MKIKIALCDDDVRALPVIAGAAESAFTAQGFQVELKRFQSGKDLLQAMEDNLFHIVMLDIDMPVLDGIQVGKEIRERYEGTPIIYVSECESRVFESFEVQPLGFVRKSNFFNDIAAVVQLYMKRCLKGQQNERIEFATRTGTLTLSSKHILYIEGNGNYQLLHLDGQQEPAEIKMTMDKLESVTEPYGFIRIHKGYLVNHQYIQRVQTSGVTLQNGVVLPVGRSKLSMVKSRLLSQLDT